MAERFALDDLAGHNLPDGTILARNRRTGAQMVLPAEVFNAISYCDAFRTMEEHISSLAGPAAGGREGEIRQILQTVVNGGLMLSASAICDSLQPADPAVQDQNPVVAIITCERPGALARLLQSMRLRCHLEGIHRVFVVDDSRDPEQVEANRKIILEARDSLISDGLSEISHFSPDKAKALVNALVASLPQHEQGIRFLLDREGRTNEVTTGITRNLAQLLAVGRPLLVFDDDVLCDVLEPPNKSPGIEFSATQRECRIFESDSDWQNAAAQTNTCPIQQHMQVLGRKLPDCLGAMKQQKPDPAAFENTRPGFASRIGSDSRIKISQCGSYGDPGSAGNEWIALLPAATRAQLGAIVNEIGTSAVERNCWLGRSRPAFEPRANMSQLTGFDNSRYLPPYFPLFRGQDRCFGTFTEFLYPNDLTVDLPFALPHLPTPRRDWKTSNRGLVIPFSLKHFLHDFVSSHSAGCQARGAEQRNLGLAMLYADLADAPRTRLAEMTANNWTQRRIDWLAKISQALNNPAEPAPLRKFLESMLRDAQENSIAQTHETPFEGPPDRGGSGEVLEYWRAAWRDLAAGLSAWPEVREAAEVWRQNKGSE
ncbi:MAG TPA: hypothetical protein VJ984_09720 [Xanthomonadales bacterium]|nr:hypothetical protein [Xanthomonadales bacterium]